jgi:putative N6-adenine-specific DNA methylase
MKLLAKTFAGLEPILAQELQELGAKNVHIIRRGVEFEGDTKLLYRANWELRTALRILHPIFQFRAQNENVFYDNIRSIDWSEFIDVKQNLAVDAVVHSEYFTHSQYIALKTKDAVVDQFRDKTGKRPNVKTIEPDLAINIHIVEDQVTVSLDTSGDSLHRRGYRVDTMEAPINEVLAAGLVLSTNWKQDCHFVEPMCGSGTIAIEAALLAHNMPPQYGRNYFSFKRLKTFDAALFRQVIDESKLRQKLSFPFEISGNDINFQAVRVAERNMEAANLAGKMSFARRDFFRLDRKFDTTRPSILVFNPPYDERLKLEDTQNFYKQIGDTLKQQWRGSTAWLISSNLEAIKNIGLKTSEKKILYNGALECRFVKFEMY